MLPKFTVKTSLNKSWIIGCEAPVVSSTSSPNDATKLPINLSTRVAVSSASSRFKNIRVILRNAPINLLWSIWKDPVSSKRSSRKFNFSTHFAIKLCELSNTFSGIAVTLLHGQDDLEDIQAVSSRPIGLQLLLFVCTFSFVTFLRYYGNLLHRFEILLINHWHFTLSRHFWCLPTCFYCLKWIIELSKYKQVSLYS